MKKNKRRHTPGFKAAIAVTALRGRYSVKEIAGHFDVNPSLVHAWRQLLAATATELFSRGKGEDDPELPSAREMDRRLSELRAEQEWMRNILAALPRRERRSCVETESDELSVLRQACLLGLHRSGIYYRRQCGDTAARTPPEHFFDQGGDVAMDCEPGADRGIPETQDF